MQEASHRGGLEGVVLREGLEGLIQNPLHFRINNPR